MISRKEEQSTEEHDNMRGGKGTITLRHYLKPESMRSNVRLCAELIVPPRAGVGLHQHDNEDEIYIVTAGSGLISEDGEDKRVNPGDAILTGNGAAHAVYNDGDSILKITAVIITY